MRLGADLQGWHVGRPRGRSELQADPVLRLLLGGDLEEIFRFCTFHEFREIVDLKLSHERFGQKREVFEVLGRVLLGVVVTKLSLQEKG